MRTEQSFRKALKDVDKIVESIRTLAEMGYKRTYYDISSDRFKKECRKTSIEVMDLTRELDIDINPDIEKLFKNFDSMIFQIILDLNLKLAAVDKFSASACVYSAAITMLHELCRLHDIQHEKE